MQANTMTCDGCGKPIDPKGDRLEIKPIRGGLGFITVRGEGFRLSQIGGEAKHFCNMDCTGKFFSALVKKAEGAIAEDKAKAEAAKNKAAAIAAG